MKEYTVLHRQLKEGGLFSGILGFGQAAKYAGFTSAWASEIEPFPIKVGKKHFPHTVQLGSVTDIHLCAYFTHWRGPKVELYLNNSHDQYIEPVDVITFGSPCQDLSVAGKRAGIDGGRSNLFFEAVRVIREMQCSTANKYPRFAIWENVPGVFSSNKGKDFAAVLESLVGGTVTAPQSRRWTNAGVAFGPEGQAAWRVLDAQFWGVPQRRKRIFLIADFGGERAGEILFERKGVSGHPSPGRKARQEVAACIGDGVEGAGAYGIRNSPKPNIGEDVMPTLLGNENAGPNQYVCGTFQNTGQGWWNESDTAATVRTPCGGDSVKANLVAQPIALNGRQDPVSGPVTGALDTDRATQCVAQCVATGTSRRYDPESETLTIQAGYSLNYQNPVRIGYAVRRLTPTECLRLQGFPDDWFDIEDASDTAKYKAAGNSLAVVCPRWILGRMARVLKGLEA